MGRSDTLLMFVGSDDVLEIPKRVEPKPVAPKPVREKKPPRKGCVVRCSPETYALLSWFALDHSVSMGRVVDVLVDLLNTDPTTLKAVISRFGY